MCGLIGMAGDVSGNKKKAFEELLAVDIVRGPHSTGVGLVHRWKNEMSVCKSVGPPSELFYLRDYQDMMKTNAKVFIGHNRYATIGKIIDENAHPFMFPNVMGAHNGTLESKARARLHQAEQFGTDSQAIFNHINEFGAEETFKILNNESYSSNAWALTWYDAEENTLNIARNSKRPLYYLYSEDMCTVFWASELPMLQWILRRNHVKLDKDPFVCVEDSHYSWEIPKNINDKFSKPTISKIEKGAPLEEVFSFRNYHEHTSSHNPIVFPILDNNKKNKKTLDRLHIDTKKWKPPYKDYNGQPIGKVRLMDKISDGCTFCPPKIAATFKENFKWGDFLFFMKPDLDGRSLFLCKECYDDPEIKRVCQELI